MNTTRRRFLATIAALPAALTQCSPEPVVPSIGVDIGTGKNHIVSKVVPTRILKTLTFNGHRVGVVVETGKVGYLVKQVNGLWTRC